MLLRSRNVHFCSVSWLEKFQEDSGDKIYIMLNINKIKGIKTSYFSGAMVSQAL